MSRTSHRVSAAAGLAAAALAATAGLTACTNGNAQPPAPLSNYQPADESSADTSKWTGYTFTIGDNGGDGSQELAAATGVFANAPYRVKFARFTYGPPLIQAAWLELKRRSSL